MLVQRAEGKALTNKAMCGRLHAYVRVSKARVYDDDVRASSSKQVSTHGFRILQLEQVDRTGESREGATSPCTRDVLQVDLAMIVVPGQARAPAKKNRTYK